MTTKLTSHNSDDQMKLGGNDDTRKHLEVGKEYKVVKIEQHSWHTKYVLEGFEDYVFNSVNFDDGESPEIEA